MYFRWMNKMGLAAIVFDASNFKTTAGFSKPEHSSHPAQLDGE